MNEPAAGDQITEVLNDDLHLTDTDNLDGTDDADEEPPPAGRTREGLPPGFRMRHEPHYVDELMSRTVHDTAAAPERIESRAGTEASPAPPGTGPALGVIADRLESLVAHQHASRAAFSPSLIAQSVQVELLRVTRLARAAATLEHREPPIRVELSGREIVDTSTRAGAPVARLAGIEFDVSVDDPAFAILAEPALVTLGIAATVDAVVDLLLADPRRQPALDGRQPAARISISLQTVRVRPAMIIDVFCPTLVVSAAHAARFFEGAADDYRTAPAAGVLLAAAAHVVRAHGGRADVKCHNASGATITYVFPQTP